MSDMFNDLLRLQTEHTIRVFPVGTRVEAVVTTPGSPAWVTTGTVVKTKGTRVQVEWDGADYKGQRSPMTDTLNPRYFGNPHVVEAYAIQILEEEES